ncbi:MAG: hypothetical protein LBT04_07335 [Prevotellaceae bacterium]|jgi:hypothetical protein|nr:hypothetical protein [Prevotellaceae bacterium]
MKQIKVFQKENQKIAAHTLKGTGARNAGSNSSFRLKKNIFLPLLIAAMTVTMNLQAQVRIGKDLEPEKGTILDLNAKPVSGYVSGLLLPNVEITNLNEIPSTFTDTGIDESQLTGLVVYSLTPCPGIYVWNGTEWKKLGCPCPLPPDAPDIAPTQEVGCNSTVADLLPSGLNWYDVPTGGTALLSTTALSSLGASPFTLYASRTVSGVESARTVVTVTLGDCNNYPVTGNITTFVKVMYDFQHQKLEAYDYNAAAANFQWQVSKDGGTTYTNIPAATNPGEYIIPANFANAYGLTSSNRSISLYFRCIYNFNAAVRSTNPFEMIFINTSDYLTDGNGRKYVTLGKGSGGQTVDNGSTAKMKMLLLNLGQSGDSYTPGSSDAGDLGDFYQWGRVADGHEKTVWSKNASTHANIIDNPAFGQPNGTSGVVARSTTAYGENTDFPDSYGQILKTDNTYLGKLITGFGDWNNNATINRWGNSGGTTRASDIPLSGWTYPSNNPCPGADGWKVPSRWNFWDLYKGTGTDTSIAASNYDGSDNS